MLEAYDWVRRGGADTVTDAVSRVTGEDPRPVEDWLSEMRGAFVGRPGELSPPSFG